LPVELEHYAVYRGEECADKSMRTLGICSDCEEAHGAEEEFLDEG